MVKWELSEKSSGSLRNSTKTIRYDRKEPTLSRLNSAEAECSEDAKRLICSWSSQDIRCICHINFLEVVYPKHTLNWCWDSQLWQHTISRFYFVVNRFSDSLGVQSVKLFFLLYNIVLFHACAHTHTLKLQGIAIDINTMLRSVFVLSLSYIPTFFYFALLKRNHCY